MSVMVGGACLSGHLSEVEIRHSVSKVGRASWENLDGPISEVSTSSKNLLQRYYTGVEISFFSLPKKERDQGSKWTKKHELKMVMLTVVHDFFW